MAGPEDVFNGSDRQNYAEEMQVDVAHPVMVPRAPSLTHEDSFSSSSSAGAVITKGPSQATTQVIFSSHVVPSLVDSLMNSVPVNTTTASTEDVITLVNVCYIGGWYPGTSNEFIINILQKCGKITHFKRHTDPSNGVVANFAFCDFDTAGGAYYAVNCLSGLPFGSSNIKVRCSDHVKANIEAWKQQEILDIKKANYGISDEAALEQFKSPEEDLKNEFATLMRFEVIVLQKATYAQTESQVDASNAGAAKLNADSTTSLGKTKGDATSSTSKPPRALSPSRRTSSNDGMNFTSREYTVHPKEALRMSRLRQKKKSYDDRYRQELRKWLEQEEALLDKLQRVGKVKQSTRERLVRDDLHGRPASNPKARRREREMDAKDAQAEAAEATADSKMTVAIKSTTTAAASAPVTSTSTAATASAKVAPKVPLANIFASAGGDDDDDYDADDANGLFKSRHRPFVPLGDVTEDDIWKLVPRQSDTIFAFNLDWDTILADGTLVQLLEPWIKTCINQYMGQDENDQQLVQEVIEFITGRLQEKPSPRELLQEVKEFLDEESQGFVTQLWKRLIFQHYKLLQTSAQ